MEVIIFEVLQAAIIEEEVYYTYRTVIERCVDIIVDGWTEYCMHSYLYGDI